MSRQPARQNLSRLIGTALGPLAGLLLIVLFFAAADWLYGHGGFASLRNFRVVLTQSSTVAVAALGMTLIIIAGGIDLSAGTALALCATVLAYLLKAEYPLAVALAATVAAGCLCGMVNGVLISTLRVVPFIVTLGTMTIFLGAGNILSGETSIYPPRSNIPDWLLGFLSSAPPDVRYWLGVPWPNIPLGVWTAVALAAMVAAVLRYTVFGRHVFAVGSNEATARLCGIDIARTKIAVYTLAGFFVGMAGAFHFARLKIGNPTEGRGLELDIIAAVVIGGGSLHGGRGSVVGTLTGAVIMTVIRSGCNHLTIPTPWTNIVIGAIIIAAVALDQLRRK